MFNFYTSLGLRGEIKYKLGDLDGAISDIQLMEKNGVRSSKYWKALGEIYALQNNKKMACEYYIKYCEFVQNLDPYDPKRRMCIKVMKKNCN